MINCCLFLWYFYWYFKKPTTPVKANKATRIQQTSSQKSPWTSCMTDQKSTLCMADQKSTKTTLLGKRCNLNANLNLIEPLKVWFPMHPRWLHCLLCFCFFIGRGRGGAYCWFGRLYETRVCELQSAAKRWCDYGSYVYNLSSNESNAWKIRAQMRFKPWPLC